MDKKHGKQPKVAIIITSLGMEELLFKCLNSIKKKTNYKNYKVYLVDDSGKGKNREKIKKKYSWIKIIINLKNLGFSKANNIGIKTALQEYNPKYFLLLNDDTEIVDKNWLRNMINVGESDEKIGILGCKLIYPDGKLQNIGGYLRGWEIVKELNNRKDVFEVDHVMGAFMIIKSSVIEKMGFLDEIYTPFLLEDTDYCLRAKKAGFKIVSVGDVQTIHKKGKTIDSLKNKRIIFIRFKNDIIFSLRNLSPMNALFRILIYLPVVAIFKKRNDEDQLKIKNFILRKDFLINIGIYFFSLAYSPINLLFRK